MSLRGAAVNGALAALVCLAAAIGLAVGSVHVGVGDVLGALGLFGGSARADHEAVFVVVRAPRVVLGALVGAGLGASGAAMQGIFRNPLVDPGLLGVSSGGAAAAVLGIVASARLAHELPGVLGPYVVSACAFAGSLGAIAAVERVARTDGRAHVTTLLLAGIAVNAIASAITGLGVFLATDAEVRSVTFWMLGSLGGATWRVTIATAPFVLAPLFVLPRLARPLDALLLGEREAGHLGFDVERSKRLVLAASALAVGASVAVAGVIAFVGLLVPHVARLLVGPSHRALLPAAAALGAALLVLADAGARTLASPAEVPLGILTTGMGAPAFLALLARHKRRFA